MNANLTDLFASPVSGSGYAAVLVAALVLGMLAATAYFARAFSKGIAGFDYAKMFAASPIAIGDRLYGMFGRQFFGRINAKALDRSETRQAVLQKKFNAAPVGSRAETYYANRLTANARERAKYERKADQKYQIGTTKLGQEVLKNWLGAQPKTVGGPDKGYLSATKEQAKALGEQARKTAELSKTAEKAIRENAVKEAARDHDAKATKHENNVIAAETRTAADTKDGKQKDAKAWAAEVAKARQEHEQHAEALKKEVDKGTGANPSEVSRLQDQMRTAQARIEEASKHTRELQSGIDAAVEARDNHKANKGKMAQDAADEAVKKAKEKLADQMENMTEAFVRVEKPLATLANPRLVSEARSAAKKGASEGAKREGLLKDIFDKIEKDKGGKEKK